MDTPACLQYTQTVDRELHARAERSYVDWCHATKRVMTHAKRERYIHTVYLLLLCSKQMQQTQQKGGTP